MLHYAMILIAVIGRDYREVPMYAIDFPSEVACRAEDNKYPTKNAGTYTAAACVPLFTKVVPFMKTPEGK